MKIRQAKIRERTSVFYTPHRKRIRPVAGIIGHRIIILIHPMRPGFPGAVSGGTPQEGGGIFKLPEAVEKLNAGQQGIEP